MDFEGFTETILKEIQKKTAGNAMVKKVRKNNGVEMDGLGVQENGNHIFPVVYLNPYYCRYLDGRSVEQLIDDIYAAYMEKGMADGFDVSQFTDFRRAKPNIVFRLVNYERNERLLEEIPFRKFLDLAVVFCVLVCDVRDKGQASVLIHNEHLVHWDVTIKEIESLAYQNTPKLLGYDFIGMGQILGKLCLDKTGKKIFHPKAGVVPEMTILTNHSRLNGAACLLYPDILREFSQKTDSNLAILPSSIHEVILISVKEDTVPDREEFCRMICEVNETQVADTEILSDHPYFYDRTATEISAA